MWGAIMQKVHCMFHTVKLYWLSSWIHDQFAFNSSHCDWLLWTIVLYPTLYTVWDHMNTKVYSVCETNINTSSTTAERYFEWIFFSNIILFYISYIVLFLCVYLFIFLLFINQMLFICGILCRKYFSFHQTKNWSPSYHFRSIFHLVSRIVNIENQFTFSY